MVKTLSEFWNEVASICYDSSDYGIIAQVRSQFRTNEINKFVNAEGRQKRHTCCHEGQSG